MPTKDKKSFMPEQYHVSYVNFEVQNISIRRHDIVDFRDIPHDLNKTRLRNTTTGAEVTISKDLHAIILQILAGTLSPQALIKQK